MRKLFFFGGIGQLGGALTELWDTLRLLRRRGVEVALLVEAKLDENSRRALAAIDCPVFDAREHLLAAVPGLAGSLVVGLCSGAFLSAVPQLRQMHCRLVWYNCMSWVFPGEETIYRQHGFFDAHLYNSPFQRAQLEEVLCNYGYGTDLGLLIRPAFQISDWDFAPRRRQTDDAFVVGRLARPDLSKWSKRTWEIYGRIGHPRRSALLMGVDETIRKWLGPAPEWAELLAPCALPVPEYFRRLHCMIPLTYSALECWPRIGLEAMASGVPVIAPRLGGWCDMIAHGENGFLAGSADEFVAQATELALDDNLRLRIASQARQKLEADLASQDICWAGWQNLLNRLSA